METMLLQLTPKDRENLETVAEHVASLGRDGYLEAISYALETTASIINVRKDKKK